MTSRKFTYSNHPNHAARSAHIKGERQFKTYDTSHIRPKKSKVPLIFGIVLAAVILGLAIWGGNMLLNTINKGSLADGVEVQITIPDGTGAKAIGTLLQDNGVIASANEFVNRVGELGADSDLKPGTYNFKGGMTLDQVIAVLRLGPESTYDTFTIPEGFTLQQTAQRVEDSYGGKVTADDFLACANNASDYEADFPFVKGAYNNSLEGFLFPKTYTVDPNATADDVVRMMLTQFQTETASLDYTFAQGKNLSAYQVLIIASMIEREAMLDEERPTISSVIYNRLGDDMLLQIDATIAYATGVPEVTPDDLTIESPYNTYTNKGLPPGPICSPGLASLQAATNPASTGYYYYVASNEGDGSHHFSETYDEQLAYIDGH